MNEMISVVIPTYNRGAFICETIESVFSQSYSSHEVIVIDDGSTDNTAELIKRYLGYPNFSYHYQSNKGRSSARNEGARLANGEWIMYLDSDDHLEKEGLTKLYSLAQSTGSELVFANFVYVENGKRIPGQKHQFSGSAANADLFKNFLAGDFCFTKTGTYLIKKSLLQKIGDFSSDFEPGEDYDFALRSLLNSRVSYIDDIVLLVHRHSENTSLEDIERSFIKIWKHYLEYPSLLQSRLKSRELEETELLFISRIANSSYELGNHSEAFQYYKKLVGKKPVYLFRPFIFKQLFASLLPPGMKNVIKKKEK